MVPPETQKNNGNNGSNGRYGALGISLDILGTLADADLVIVPATPSAAMLRAGAQAAGIGVAEAGSVYYAMIHADA